MHRPPYFFWDFTATASFVVVQSDIDAYPVIASFALDGNNAPRQIELAEALIADLTAGRITVKQAMARPV
jgi:hypothetical protein